MSSSPVLDFGSEETTGLRLATFSGDNSARTESHSFEEFAFDLYVLHVLHLEARQHSGLFKPSHLSRRQDTDKYSLYLFGHSLPLLFGATVHILLGAQAM